MFTIHTTRICDGMCSASEAIAHTQQPDSCFCSVSAQLQLEVKKSCSNHAAEHQDRLHVARDELLDLKVHVWLHLNALAAWRRSCSNRSCISSCVDGGVSMSTCRGLGQLHPGTDSSKIALEKLYFAASSVDQTGSAATTAAIAVPSLPRGLRHCDRVRCVREGPRGVTGSNSSFNGPSLYPHFWITGLDNWV